MSSKKEMIQKMLEMQKKFIEHEHAQGVDPVDYFAPKPGSDLDGYRQEYHDLAMTVVETAHKEVGSKP